MTQAITCALQINRKLSFVRWFNEIGIEDVTSVGGKNASLGEMYRALMPLGVRVPNGFALTADAYRAFLQDTGLESKIATVLVGLDCNDVANLQRRGQEIRDAIMAAELPPDVEDAIRVSYAKLSEDYPPLADVAVRSSATAEDFLDASFAGQHETYLNVQGLEHLWHSCKRCFASLFTDRAILYRGQRGLDQLNVALSIGVQKMVRSDLAASGVMFTIDTETEFPEVVLINASYGLGENVVRGSVNPDEYCVFKPLPKAGFHPILQKTVGTKELKLIYDVGGGRMVKNVPVPLEARVRFALSDEDILALSRWACIIENHYSYKAAGPTPMAIEWAKDGQSGELFIVQARPETLKSRRQLQVLAKGRSVGEAIVEQQDKLLQHIN